MTGDDEDGGSGHPEASAIEVNLCSNFRPHDYWRSVSNADASYVEVIREDTWWFNRETFLLNLFLNIF